MAKAGTRACPPRSARAAAILLAWQDKKDWLINPKTLIELVSQAPLRQNN